METVMSKVFNVLISTFLLTTWAAQASQLCPFDIPVKKFDQVTSPTGIKKNAVIRDAKGNLVVESVLLEDLVSTKSFEGKYFKIVLAKNDEAISFDADEALTLKATSVYYHITRARKFAQKLNENKLHEIFGQMTIRIEIDNKFHRSFHYIHEDNEKIYNNATTVVCGRDLSIEVDGQTQTIKGWGPEIWFRKAQKTKLKNKMQMISQMMDEAYPNQDYFDTNSLLYLSLTAAKAKSLTIATSALEDMGIHAASEFAAHEFAKGAIMLMTPSHFFLESSLVPEVIYHEYTHLLIGDYLPPSVNNPLIEGFCDFFASRVGHTKVLADKLKQYGELIQARSATNTKPFKMSFDTITDSNGSDYILSLFTQIQTKLEEKGQAQDDVENEFYNLRKGLNTASNIRNDLPKALIQTFKNDKRTLLPILLQRGL
jgi:hypothetical protein